MAQNLNQVPPDLEVWEVAGTKILVKVLNHMTPPVYIFWRVESADRAAGLGIKKVDRKFASWGAFGKTGALNMGGSLELLNTTEDPYDQVLSAYQTEVKVKPWLADPEILAIWLGASMEERHPPGITEAELQGTEWWRSHTETERQWLSMNASDPSTADALIADNRLRVADLFSQAGVSNASVDLIDTVADNWTTGAWTEVYATTQIRLLADPNLSGSLDAKLKAMRNGLDTTRLREDDVKATVAEWLGPQMAGQFGADFYTKWASRLREDPDAGQALDDVLRKQFQTHINIARDGKRIYGDDANLTYEDVAAPWRGVWQEQLGQVADETDDLFMRILRTNDLATAERLLRSEGIDRGNSTVVQRALSDVGKAFGGSVRPADAAVR